MQTGTKAAIAIAIFVAGAAAARSHVYLSLESASGTAMWNASEAYFFISTQYIGHRVNGLRFPWFLVENFLGGVEDPDALVEFLDVIRVTSSGVEHHVLKQKDRTPGAGPGGYTPLEGRIYLSYPEQGGLCRWDRDHFEQVPPAEQQRLDLRNRLTYRDIENDESGWSKRGFPVGPGQPSLRLRVELGGSSQLSVDSSLAIAWHRMLSVDVRRRGRAAERVWDVGLRWWFVRGTEYQRIFH